MLSYSTDTTKRKDEQCGNTIIETQARRRFGRDVEAVQKTEDEEATTITPDVEIFPPQVV